MSKETALEEVEKVNGAPATIGKEVYNIDGRIVVYEWDSQDGEFWGYVRDDLSGISVVTCFESGEDEETVAAWNCDFPIDKYLNRIDKKTMDYLLQIAQEKGWDKRLTLSS